MSVNVKENGNLKKIANLYSTAIITLIQAVFTNAETQSF